MANRVPDRLPEDLEAERSFLATCCAPGAEALASEAVVGMSPSDFVHPAHQAVFSALLTLLSRGEEIHALSLKIALEEAAMLGRVGGFSGLVDLLAAEDVGRPQALAAHLLEKSRLRRLVHVGASLMRSAAAEEAASAELISGTSAVLAGLAQGAHRKGLVPVADLDERTWARIEDVREGRRSAGVPTGFGRLDWLLGGGFQPGQVVVLAARPGVGKSTLLVQWLRHIASHHGPAALFALEMADEEIWTRAIGSEASVPSGLILSGRLDHSAVQRLVSARERLRGLPLSICDQASITIPEIRALSSSALTRGGLTVVGIDYLQLLSSAAGSRGAKQNEATRIGEISRDVKLMAKDLGLPVVLLSQLNREVEHRSGGRPQLSDLRDSGAVEQDADVVVFVHRRGDGEDASFELVIAKNRNGPTGIVPLVADLKFFRFLEMSRETAPSTPSADRRSDAYGDDL